MRWQVPDFSEKGDYRILEANIPIPKKYNIVDYKILVRKLMDTSVFMAMVCFNGFINE